MKRTRMPALLRVEAFLGEPLDEMTGAGIERLVQNRVAEDEQLDFKRYLYKADDNGRHELAKDVCAFANGSGGAIICGVAEAVGVAHETVPLAVSEPELRRLRSTIASNTAPMPLFDLVTVPSTDGAGSYLVIVVPPSALAPHAALRDHLLGYPVRYGTQTRWLSENEIADRYRSRTRLASEALDRLREVVDKGIAALGKRAAPWLIVGFAPTAAGHIQLSSSQLGRLRTWLQGQEQSVLGRRLFDFDRAVTGFRRITFSYGTEQPGAGPGCAYVELGADGATFAATELRQPEQPRADWIPGRVGVFPMEELFEWTAAALPLAAEHALVHAGAWGDAVATVRVLGAAEGAKYERVMLVHHIGAGMLSQRRQSQVEVGATPFAPRTLDVDALSDGRELLQAVRLVAGDVANALGWTEVPHVDQDGQLVLGAFPATSRDSARAWAARVGAPLAER